MSLPSLNVIGAGRAAGTVAAALAASGQVRIAQVLNRTAGSSHAAAGRLAGDAALPETLAPADWWLVGVPDDELEPVARALGQRFGDQATLAFHLSGACPIALLRPLTRNPAGFHPVRAFPERIDNGPAALAALAGTAVGIAGESPARARLRGAAEALAMVPFALPEGARPRYHAACSIAANYSVALGAAAQAEFEAAGLPSMMASRLTRDLLGQTAAHGVAHAPADQLTGPIARGDAGTVAQQLAAIDPSRRALFLLLGRACLELVRDRLAPGAVAELESVLGSGDAA